MSDLNKLLIRCAWKGNPAFDAVYGPGWGPGTCPATFTTKASLKKAVQVYNTNSTVATATYGLIAYWDVSAITDMSGLFDDMQNFDADISNWHTSGVTSMYQMFRVRFSRALPSTSGLRSNPCTLLEPLTPSTTNHELHVCRARALPLSAVATSAAHCLPPRSPVASRVPASSLHRTACTHFDSRQGALAFNKPLSFDTSSVTDMGVMFEVRSPRALLPTNLQPSPPLRAAAVARRLPPPGPYTSPRTICPPFDSR